MCGEGINTPIPWMKLDF